IRRISVVVKFPAPGPAERELIFRAHLPPEAPVSDDLDLEFLAERMEVSGGQIKNIVLAAAFMAAAERKPISMSHLVRASGQELRKTGKIFVKEIFSPYSEDLGVIHWQHGAVSIIGGGWSTKRTKMVRSASSAAVR